MIWSTMHNKEQEREPPTGRSSVRVLPSSGSMVVTQGREGAVQGSWLRAAVWKCEKGVK